MSKANIEWKEGSILFKIIFDYEGIFSRSMRFVADLFFLNVLIIITSLPIFTLGVSITSSIETWKYFKNGEHQNIFRAYWHHFKSNSKNMVPISFLYVLLFTILVCDIIYVVSINSIFSNLKILFIVILLISIVSFISSCAIKAFYETDTKKVLKNGVLLTFQYIYLVPALLMPLLFLYLLVQIGGPNILSMVLFIAVFFGASLFTLYCRFIYDRVFQKNLRYGTNLIQGENHD